VVGAGHTVSAANTASAAPHINAFLFLILQLSKVLKVLQVLQVL
jgi:hypothetical protein